MSVWKTRPLGELCSVVAGGTPARANTAHFGGDIPWVKIGDMLQGVVRVTDETITDLAIRNSAAKILPKGTVLVSIFATIGRTAILGVEAATNQAIVGLTPRDPKVISPSYVRRYLDHVVGELESRAQGVAQANINSTILKSIDIPLPTMSEQLRILEMLDLVDRLCAQRRAAIALLDDLAQSIFLDMFGDPLTDLRRWGAADFGNLVTEFRYGTSVKSAPEGHPTLRIPNVVGGVVDTSDLKLVPASTSEADRLRLADGDVLFVRTNGNPDYVGRCAIFTRDSVATSGWPAHDFIYASYLIRARLRTDRVDPVFVRQFMLGSAGRRALRNHSKTSAGQYNINIQGLRGVRLPVPPVALQSEFGSRIAAVERSKAHYLENLVELDALFAAVQYRAFRGELWEDTAN